MIPKRNNLKNDNSEQDKSENPPPTKEGANLKNTTLERKHLKKDNSEQEHLTVPKREI